MSRGATMYALVRLVRPLTLASARVVEQDLRGRGVTVGGRAVLEILAEGGAASVPEVAGVLEVSRQAVQRLVNELAGAGLVRTTPNPRHRRSPLVDLTATGRELFAGVRARELDRLATVAPECSERELATALRVLTAVSRDVRERARAGGGAG